MKRIVTLLMLIIAITPFLHGCKPSPETEAKEKQIADSILAIKTSPQQVYLNSAVTIWTGTTEELEKYLNKRLEPVEMPDKDYKTRFLVKYLSFNDVGFDSLNIYESESVKKFLYDEQVVAIVGSYQSLPQEKKGGSGDINIVNLMFLGTPMKISNHW